MKITITRTKCYRIQITIVNYFVLIATTSPTLFDLHKFLLGGTLTEGMLAGCWLAGSLTDWLLQINNHSPIYQSTYMAISFIIVIIILRAINLCAKGQQPKVILYLNDLTPNVNLWPKGQQPEVTYYLNDFTRNVNLWAKGQEPKWLTFWMI